MKERDRKARCPMENQFRDLPENVARILKDFIATAQSSIGANLLSITLYGSAAEGRLRPTSDVNLLMVLKEFDVAQIDGIRESLRFAFAAIRLHVMIILESEIRIASEAFAVKFIDITNRHRVLLGSDPFRSLDVSRQATLDRLRQVIVNLMLRMRERYALVSLREEQLVPMIAEAAGPIRTCASAILNLQGKTLPHPKDALWELAPHLGNRDWSQTLKCMSRARDERSLEPGESVRTVLDLLALLKAMHVYVEEMS